MSVKELRDLLKAKFKFWNSQISENCFPEFNESPFLECSEISKYQMMIVSLNWIVAPGKFDVPFCRLKLARDAQCLKLGHLKAAQRVFRYFKSCYKDEMKVDTLHPTLQGEKKLCENGQIST